jgi:hypothetical protein
VLFCCVIMVYRHELYKSRLVCCSHNPTLLSSFMNSQNMTLYPICTRIARTLFFRVVDVLYTHPYFLKIDVDFREKQFSEMTL